MESTRRMVKASVKEVGCSWRLRPAFGSLETDSQKGRLKGLAMMTAGAEDYKWNGGVGAAVWKPSQEAVFGTTDGLLGRLALEAVTHPCRC